MSDDFNDLINFIVGTTVNGGSGGRMIPTSPYLTDDDEPVEGDEQWIPHDELSEQEQDGWR